MVVMGMVVVMVAIVVMVMVVIVPDLFTCLSFFLLFNRALV